MVAEEGRRGGGDGQVTFSPPGAKNYTSVCAASAGIGQVSASAAALRMLQSGFDGKAAPAVSPCFSRALLQRVGLICCLLA